MSDNWFRRLWPFGRPPTARIVLGNVGEIRFTLHSKTDRFISEPIARGEIFDRHITELMLALLGPDDVLVDVGSNIGWFSVIGSRLAEQVISIEPDLDNARLLRANLRANRCKNVTVYPVALGAGDHQAWLYRSAENQGDHQLSVVADRDDRVRVKVRSLDSLLGRALQRVTWIKLDTQGSEVAILRGMRRTLEQRPRLVIEFWPQGLERCGASADELIGLLATLDSDVWLLLHDGAAERVDPQRLADLASTTYTPSIGAHADLVVVPRDDWRTAAYLDSRVRVTQPPG